METGLSRRIHTSTLTWHTIMNPTDADPDPDGNGDGDGDEVMQ